MAPDSKSIAAARKLSAPGGWLLLATRGDAIWGEVRGSGKKPYRVGIDLTGPAFKCSCPSRKFPCKHGLALAYVVSEDAGGFVDADPPEWIDEWLAKRAGTAARKSAREAQAKEPVSEETLARRRTAQEKRSVRRDERMRDGVESLREWTRDLVRQGLAAVAEWPWQRWEETAARMVDAQAPGLATRLRELGGLVHSGDGWRDRWLEKLGALHLLAEAATRLEALPTAARDEVRAQLGLTQSKDELLASAPSVADRWHVLGLYVDDENDLKTRRTWLWAHDARRFGCLLEFAPRSGSFLSTMMPGTCYEAELVHYPGLAPLRALVKGEAKAASCPSDGESLGAFTSVDAALEGFRAARIANPWLWRYPAALRDVVPRRDGDRWLVQDASGSAVGLAPRADVHRILAASGGHAIDLFGEWDGHRLTPLAADGGDGLALLGCFGDLRDGAA